MKFYILLPLLIIGSSVAAQLNNTNSFFDGSYNKKFISSSNVKRIIVKSWIKDRTPSITFYDFDTLGFLQNQTSVDSTGKKMREFTFIYNVHGDQIERKETDYQFNETYSSTFKRSYQGSQLIEEKWSLTPHATTYHYYSGSQRTHSVTIFGNDSTISPRRIVQYIYDKKGRLKSSIMVEKIDKNESTFPELTNYEFNATGDVVAVKRDKAATAEYSYDKIGLLKQEKITMPEDFGGIEMFSDYSYLFH